LLESFVGDMFLVCFLAVYPVIYRVLYIPGWYKISSINSIFKKSDGIQLWGWGISMKSPSYGRREPYKELLGGSCHG